MLEPFLQIDKTLFILINHLPHNLIFDSFFSLLSGIGKWGIIWFVIAAILFFWEKRKNHHKLVALIISLFASTLAVELILKNLIGRLRPEEVLENVILVGESAHSYSFPSGHATIAFAAAYILGTTHKKLKRAYFFLAFLIAFSRIYLGQHYLSDVIFAAVLGLLIGYFSIRAMSRFT